MAYPAFDWKRNDNPGTGSGPMGGPGAFAPGNTPVVHPRGSDPIKNFLAGIGVAGADASGQAIGSTGGLTHMWEGDRATMGSMIVAQQEAEAEAKRKQANGAQQDQAQTNAFLAPKTAAAPASPMAGNAFMGGNDGVRVNGLTPATLAPGGTPMVGRDYGTAQPMGRAGLGSLNGDLASEVALSDGPVSRNGALFGYGAGQGFSITQDPMTVPAQGGAGGAALSPDAMAVIGQGVGQFKGPDANNQFLTALDSGAFDQKPLDGATPQQIAALNLRNQQIRQEAKAALPRLMLPNTGNAGVDAERMKTFMGTAENAFMPKPTAATGAVDKLAKQATGGAVDYNESLTAFTEMAKKNGQVVTTQVQIDKSGRPTVQATFHDAKTLDDGSKKKFDELSRERTAIVGRLSAIDMNTMNNAMALPQKKEVDKERKRLAKIEEDLNGLIPGSVVPYGQDDGTATGAATAAPGLEAGRIYPDANGNLGKFKGGDPKDAANWEPVAR